MIIIYILLGIFVYMLLGVFAIKGIQKFGNSTWTQLQVEAATWILWVLFLALFLLEFGMKSLNSLADKLFNQEFKAKQKEEEEKTPPPARPPNK